MTWHAPSRNPDGTSLTNDLAHQEWRIVASLPNGTRKVWRISNPSNIHTKYQQVRQRYPSAPFHLEHRLVTDWTYTKDFREPAQPNAERQRPRW